jgi:hypothetical protein
MAAGAVMALISGIVAVLAIVNEVNGTIAGVRVSVSAHASERFLHDVSTALVVAAVIGTLIAIAVWLWMAWKCVTGRRWARIMSTVLFALSSLSLTSLHGTPAWTVLCTVVSWLIGLGAVILLWRRSSSDYFDAPRY